MIPSAQKIWLALCCVRFTEKALTGRYRAVEAILPQRMQNPILLNLIAVMFSGPVVHSASGVGPFLVSVAYLLRNSVLKRCRYLPITSH